MPPLCARKFKASVAMARRKTTQARSMMGEGEKRVRKAWWKGSGLSSD
jgi:hypothetical protein